MFGGKSFGKGESESLSEGATLVEEQLISPLSQYKKPKVIVLAGPTSCGKTALAMLIAESVGGEIISADSIQVYRGMNIGTAKATAEELRRVPHHLVDIREVTEHFNVVDFCYAAQDSCHKILARNKIPIIAGGSGFYIHALLYGPPSGPPSVPQIRKKLEDEFDAKGADFMYEKLRQFDLEYAKTITCHDRQKIIRALEIIEISGVKVSKHHWKNRRIPKNFDFRCWFLNRPRFNLYQRIENRCDKMLAHGLLEEVARMEQRGLRENSSASQAIGYRQSLDFLSGPQKRDDYLRFVASFKQASRRYAKRQLTWFRKEPLFQWIDLDLHDPETAMDVIVRDYEGW